MDECPADDARLACAAALLLLAATLAARTLRGEADGEPLHLARHRVDVNGAAAGEIEAVPGIGPVLARRIVEARTGRPFATVEDLRRVPGIGGSTLGRLEGFVRCDPR